MKKVLSLFLVAALMFMFIPGIISPMVFEAAVPADSELVDGVYYKIDGDHAVVTGCSDTATEIVISSEYNGYPVTQIADSAFENKTSLKKVTIADSVTSIGEGAFLWCSGLTSVTIPNSVTSIGASAFSCCTGLVSVTIPASVTSIGDSAFLKCTDLKRVNITDLAKWCEINFNYSYSNPLYYAHNLYLNDELVTDLVIPNEVTSIGQYSFYSCTSLTSVTIADSVTSIGNLAFYGCTGLSSITIPDSVTQIGSHAFDGCTELKKVNITDLAKWCDIDFYNLANPLYYAHNLYLNGELVTDLVIPYGITSIRDSAFGGCTSLTSVTIPDSVTSIGGGAFSGCTGLKRVNITDLAKWCDITFYFGSNPLYYAHNLYLNGELVTDLAIPHGVTSIENLAFDGCTGFTSITIPDSVTNIGNFTFRGCTGLTNITIPDSVTSIGEYAFCNCTGLANVTIPHSVTSIGNYAFSGCTGLTSITIHDSVTTIGDYAFQNCTELSNVTIPDSITCIREGTFSGCTGLTSITIPDSVTSIRRYAFEGCTGLERVNITDLAKWCDIDFTYNESSPLYYAHNLYLNGELITDIVIPYGVTKIESCAFSGCTGLTSITIPDSVTSIGYAAFSGCTGLTSITIPNSVTIIGYNAFRDCTGLTSITISNGVKSIEGDIFDGCTGLTIITIPDSVTWIEKDAFDDCENLTIRAIKDSYADTYAQENNIPVVYVKYSPDDSGKLQLMNGFEMDSRGDLRYYEDGIAVAKGLVEYEGNYYFINSYLKAVKNTWYAFSAAKANGLLPAGTYFFGEDGKLVIKNGLTFETNGDIRYYENGVAVSKGLVQDSEGNYYFINSKRKAVKNTWYAFSAAKANGLLPAGNYFFGEDGKLVIKNGLTFEANGDIRYYENGVAVSKGLVKDSEGNYYFINSYLKAVKNTWYAFSAAKANGLLPAGTYFFGEDGKLVIKNGLTFETNGDIRYYENGVAVSKGLVQDSEGNYYFINSTRKAVKNTWYAFSAAKANGLLPAGNYFFGEDGKLVQQ